MSRGRDISPIDSGVAYKTGLRAIMLRSVLEIVRRPLYWIGFFLLPLFIFLFLTSLMSSGLPTKVPAAIVDNDHSSLSRNLTMQLASSQLVSINEASESFTSARHDMQEGKVFGIFLIPENFEADLLAGRSPEITFYTNTTYFVPAALLFKSFKSTATYSKAGMVVSILESAGMTEDEALPLINPVSFSTHPIGNPWLDYAIYLCNSFIPCALQLMIFLVTCFSIGQEVKYGRSVELLRMAGGSIVKAMFGKLLPQTVIWLVVALFMQGWLFGWNHYPVNGSVGWLTLSTVLFVLASQGLAVFFYEVLPSLRMSLSVSALIGILSFSLAAFSFPVESMYPAMGIFSWIVPTRYNFLIYIDQALNGIDIYYSRYWYAAYFVFMLLPLTLLWRLKREMSHPVYAP